MHRLTLKVTVNPKAFRLKVKSSSQSQVHMPLGLTVTLKGNLRILIGTIRLFILLTWLCLLILDWHFLFSKSKDGIKYLTCADCEVGPLGFHDPTEAPLRFLIAACRVKYDEWIMTHIEQLQYFLTTGFKNWFSINLKNAWIQIIKDTKFLFFLIFFRIFFPNFEILEMLSILQEACDWLNAYMARWYYVDFHGQHRKRFWLLSFWLLSWILATWGVFLKIFDKELNVFSKLFWLFQELSDSFMAMQLNRCR